MSLINILITYMWNLKYDTNELIYETETDSQTWRTDLWFPSYLCLLATAINVDTFCDVSKLNFLLRLNKDIKRPNPPPSWGDEAR